MDSFNDNDNFSMSSSSSFEVVPSVPSPGDGNETSSWENVSSNGGGDGSSLSSSSSSSTASDMVLVQLLPSFGQVAESSDRPAPAGPVGTESNSEGTILTDEEEESSDSSMYDSADDSDYEIEEEEEEEEEEVVEEEYEIEEEGGEEEVEENEDEEASSASTITSSMYHRMDTLQLNRPAESPLAVVSEMNDMTLGPVSQGDDEDDRGARFLQSHVSAPPITTNRTPQSGGETGFVNGTNSEAVLPGAVPEAVSVNWTNRAAGLPVAVPVAAFVNAMNSETVVPVAVLAALLNGTNSAAVLPVAVPVAVPVSGFVSGMNSAAGLPVAGREAYSPQRVCEPDIRQMWNGRIPPNALSSDFQPPWHLLFKGTSAYEAIKYATEQNKLILVNVQDYSQFGSHRVNREILQNDTIQELIKSEYVLLQTTLHDPIGSHYMRHYQVRLLPHLGVIHPIDRSIIWGVKGWTDEKPWLPREIGQSLADIRFDRFSEDQLSMEIDYDETTGWGAPPLDISLEIETQEALRIELGISLDATESITNALEMQSALLQSQSTT